jgi:hypothetical protein
MPTTRGYLLSVAAASIVLAVAFDWPVPLRPSLAGLYVFEITAAFVSITAVTIGPYLVVRRFRGRWTISDSVLYPGLGLCLGLLGALLLAATSNAMGVRGDPENLSIKDGLLRFIPNFALAGLVGGLAYWWAVGRRGRRWRQRG